MTTRYGEVKEQLAMLDGAGHPFDLGAVRAGQQTPVYFGSAVNNFGIQLLLDGFLNDSVGRTATKRCERQRQSPGERQPGRHPLQSRRRYADTVAAESGRNRVVPVTYPKFSGFVFKIQANMDPKHRDRIAFRPHLLGQIRARHDGHAPAHRQKDAPLLLA